MLLKITEFDIKNINLCDPCRAISDWMKLKQTKWNSVNFHTPSFFLKKNPVSSRLKKHLPTHLNVSCLVPTAPQRLSIVDQFSDTISVSWARPRQVNGVLKGYVVKYWRVGNTRETKEIQVDGDALQAGVTSLRYKTRYMIEVAAKTRAGISASARIEGRTLDYPGTYVESVLVSTYHTDIYFYRAK